MKCSQDIHRSDLPRLPDAEQSSGILEDVDTCGLLLVDTCLDLGRSSKNNSTDLNCLGSEKWNMKRHELLFPFLPNTSSYVNAWFNLFSILEPGAYLVVGMRIL